MNWPSKSSFGRPLQSASEQLAGVVDAARVPWHVFQPCPRPTREERQFRLELDSVIGSQAVAAIEQSRVLVFHAVGDRGGVRSGKSQAIVAHDRWVARELGRVTG